MSKYEPLRKHLAQRQGNAPLSFAEIEEILGFSLPRSAYLYPAWWSNSGGTHVQSAAWQSAGYETRHVDLARHTVQFEPSERAGFDEMTQASLSDSDNASETKHPLFGCMKGTSIVMPGVDLTEPADPDWGKVYDDDSEDANFPAKGAESD